LRCNEQGECYLLGDVDNNGIVDVADALQILRAVIGLPNEITGNPQALCASLISANVPLTGNETPQIEDALLILRYAIGLQSNDRIGKR